MAAQTDTTNPSRRAALALFGAAPALAILPTVASPAPTPQLSALIEAHLAARAAFNEAIDMLEDAEPDGSIRIPVFSLEPVQARVGRDSILQVVEDVFERENEKFIRLGRLAPEIAEAARARLEQERLACVARVEEVFAAYTAAEVAYKDAAGAEEDAITALFGHRCASLEEAAAKVRYIKGSPIADEVQPEHLDALLASFLPEGEAADV